MLERKEGTIDEFHIQDLIESIRPKQWIKNLVIFCVGVICSINGFQWSNIIDLTLTFLAFCCGSSSVYVLNDYLDKEKDIKHPQKKFRPIASGKISSTMAGLIILTLAPLGLLLAVSIDTKVALLLAVYLAVNLAYCLKLKHIPHIDITCIASGFTIRALSGASAVNFEADFWIIAAITFICVALAHMKRIKEVKQLGNSGESRSVLRKYSYESLSRNQDIFIALSALSLLAYLNSLEINNSFLLAGALTGVSAILMTFSSRVQNTTEGDPTDFIYKNKVLSLFALVLLGGIAIIYSSGIYK